MVFALFGVTFVIFSSGCVMVLLDFSYQIQILFVTLIHCAISSEMYYMTVQ